MSRRREGSVDWKHLAVYGLIAAVAGIVGTVAIWALVEFTRRGGALAFAGVPPSTPIGKIHFTAEVAKSDTAVKLSEGVSPILARLNPGAEIATAVAEVAMLKESPRMNVDARWRDN